MKLRLLSDIHLELAKHATNYIKRFIPDRPSEDVLILAGDIGNPTSKIYKLFLTEMSNYYSKVFIVTGNHEYYQHYRRKYSHETARLESGFRHSIDDIDKMVTVITGSLPNVHFLQRSSVVYNRVRFIGCTLWTQSDPTLTKYMNDYEYIKDFTADTCDKLNSHDVKWLEENLVLNGDEYDRTVVVTHHLPSTKLIADKYKNHPLNGFFANNLDYYVEKADIWVCGHSHSAKFVTIGKCRCYLNPTGYTQEDSSYDINLKIDVCKE